MPRTAGWLRDRHGVAALEFALVAPVLLMVVAGIADYGMLLVGKGQLANGLAQSVGHALFQGASVTPQAISDMTTQAAARSGVAEAVTVRVTGPACFCITGQPATLVASDTPLSASNTCEGTCPDAGAPPAVYLQVSAHYTYQPFMPFYSQMAATTVSETAVVRLQ